MLKRILFVCVLFLYLLLPVSAVPEIVCPEEGYPGNVVKIILFDKTGGFEPDAVLLSPEGNQIAASRGFRIKISDHDTAWILLLGIPSVLPPGVCELIIKEKGNEEPPLYRRSFKVRQREFIHEDIPLSGTLSELRSKDDPEKYQEALFLRNLLKEFHPGDIYDFSAQRIPLDSYRVSSHFGDRRTFLYSDGEKAVAIHNGIDLAAPENTPVHACAAGRVVFSAKRIITGYSVVIEHLPGVYSSYFHLDTVLVRPDTIVSAGETIGTVGSTGLATGPHLHWEINVSGVPVDPESFIANAVIDKTAVLSIRYRGEQSKGGD